jgi:HAMP domain-containing protein
VSILAEILLGLCVIWGIEVLAVILYATWQWRRNVVQR